MHNISISGNLMWSNCSSLFLI